MKTPAFHFINISVLLLNSLEGCKLLSCITTSFIHSSTISHRNDSRNTAVRPKVFGLFSFDSEQTRVFAGL